MITKVNKENEGLKEQINALKLEIDALKLQAEQVEALTKEKKDL